MEEPPETTMTPEKELLWKARETVGLSWPALAYVFGLPQRTVANWAYVEGRTPTPTALLLCEMLTRPPREWGTFFQRRIKAAHEEFRSAPADAIARRPA